MTIDGKTLGLALSGGGFRATLFGLGSLWRLNDAGLLGRLDRITGVSGGSILLGVLAHRWRELDFAEGCARNFSSQMVAPVQTFCAQTIDVGAGIAGWLNPFKSAGDYLIARYRDDLFGATTLKDLPTPQDGAPLFTFYATSLQTGSNVRLNQRRVADYKIGENTTLAVPLATAVAASSAFPPIFSPIELETDPEEWTGGNLPNKDKLREKLVLADGGIYDNMGLEQLAGNSSDKVDIILASDAGAPFGVDEDPNQDPISQLGRVRDILIEQTRALRKRWLVENFIQGERQGAYWGVTTDIGDYGLPDTLARDTHITASLQTVKTRLSGFEPELQGQLINWGYALCDAALRKRSGLGVPVATGLPLPQWPLG